jgi:Obg family GTPase CgtA-like protein
VSVRREGDKIVVESKEAERLMALADLEDRRVRLQLRVQLDRLGITKRLLALGIKAGDRLRVGEVEMVWE